MAQEGSGRGEQAEDARGALTGRERFTACLPCRSAPTDPVLRALDTKTPSSEHQNTRFRASLLLPGQL